MITKDTYKEIQGWLTDREASALQTISANKHVLEIGVWKGKSTLAIAATANSVTAIDTFEGDNYTGKAFTLPEAIQNFRTYDTTRKISLVIQDFNCLNQNTPLSKGLASSQVVYYDADHTQEAVEQFIRLLENKFSSSKFPVIAFHDYEESAVYSKGVAVFKDWINRYTNLGMFSRLSLVVIDRLAIVIPISQILNYPELYLDG